MTPMTPLWIPILLSAVVVFVLSFLFHMVLPIHWKDYGKVPQEDQVMEALRKFEIPPGEYLLPCAGSPKQMGNPEFVAKMKQGPVAILSVAPSGPPAMGKALLAWFLYCVVVTFFATYITSHALAPGAHYLGVFRFIGGTAFIGYSLALWQGVIWEKRSGKTAIKSTIDGLVYALFTAGIFGWLWPA